MILSWLKLIAAIAGYVGLVLLVAQIVQRRASMRR